MLYEVITIGKNTQIEVEADASTEPPTSPAPSEEASIAPIPSEKCLLVFSRTTMELSTIIPIATVIPDRLSMFSVVCVRYIPIIVISIEIGSDSPIIRVLLMLCRKIYMMNTASIIPEIAV